MLVAVSGVFWSPLAGDPVAHSDHPSAGPATPLPGSYGTLPTAAQKAAGDALGASLHASSGRTGVHYLIWYGRIGNADRAREGWRPYHGAGVYTSAPSTPAGRPLRPRPYLGLLNSKAAAPRHL